MMNRDTWQFKEANNPSRNQRFILMVFVVIGIWSIVSLFEWWFTEFHIANKLTFVVLSFFFWYEILRVIVVWFTYLSIKKPIYVPEPEKGLQVAIFTTSAPGEPLSMFENTFKALQGVQYPHTTYLLDSTGDASFKALADQYGVVFKDYANIPGAKAGKVNKALADTDEEFILILDPDHIVFPNFLDQTLGFFKDPKVGFVQVSQGYYNQYRSFVARGAAEQTYFFYGPTQMGLNRYSSAVAIGANCTFRRSALESIGGHAMGLAEDLQTSLRLHAAGWESIYNPVIVSRGLVPEDFGSFCKQQLKWARGVFEVLYDDLPKNNKGLNWWQKLFYLNTATYYFFGFTNLVFITVPLLYFFGGIIPGNMVFTDFLIKLFPFVIASVGIYFLNQQFLCDKTMERGFHWRAMVLKFACWPVIVYAFMLSLLRKKIPYIPTEKNAQQVFITPFVKPLIAYVILFIIGVVLLFGYRWFFVSDSELLLSSSKNWGMLGFASIAFIQSIAGILAAYEALGLKPEDPWRRVNVEKDKILIKNK